MPDGLTFASIQEIRRHKEAACARQSNARARSEGWYQSDWDTIQTYRGPSAGGTPRAKEARAGVLKVMGDDWQSVSDIVVKRQAEDPFHSDQAIRRICRMLELSGLAEGRLVDADTPGGYRKQYRVARKGVDASRCPG